LEACDTGGGSAGRVWRIAGFQTCFRRGMVLQCGFLRKKTRYGILASIGGLIHKICHGQKN
jgi:hypothetical protein